MWWIPVLATGVGAIVWAYFMGRDTAQSSPSSAVPSWFYPAVLVLLLVLILRRR